MDKPRTDWSFVIQICVLVVVLTAALATLQVSFVALEALRTSTETIKAGDALQAIANLVGSFGGALLAGFAAIAAGIVIYRQERAERIERDLSDHRRMTAEFATTESALVHWLRSELSSLIITLNTVASCAQRGVPHDEVAVVIQYTSQNHKEVGIPAEIRARIGDHFTHALAPLDDMIRNIGKLGTLIATGMFKLTAGPNAGSDVLDPSPDWAYSAATAVQNVLLPLQQIMQAYPNFAGAVLAHDQVIRRKAEQIQAWALAQGARKVDFSRFLVGPPGIKADPSGD